MHARTLLEFALSPGALIITAAIVVAVWVLVAEFRATGRMIDEDLERMEEQTHMNITEANAVQTVVRSLMEPGDLNIPEASKALAFLAHRSADRLAAGHRPDTEDLDTLFAQIKEITR